MADRGRVHDRAILDALEQIDSEPFQGAVWRVARAGRDPLRGSGAHGRWSPAGEFEVLYPSLEREGALAEIGYRLSLEPIWPSRIEHDIHFIAVETVRTLHFANVESLSGLGVDVARYASFDYAATQAIASAAHFLEFDGLLVPSARYACANLVIFLDRLLPDGVLSLQQTEPIDWRAWRDNQKKQ